MRALDRIFRRRAISQAIKKLVLWTPASLFANNEQGAYFDPNNSATLFEDAAGTTPTALERPVGLMLDQSKGLVPGGELVINGDFSNGTTGWSTQSGSSSVVSGKLQVNSTHYARVTTPITLTPGKWYVASFDFTKVDASGWLMVGTDTGLSAEGRQWPVDILGASASKSYRFIASQASLYIGVVVESGTSGAVNIYDNISIKELPGNHATSSSTARPTLTRRVNQFVNSEALATQSVTTRATTQTLRFEGAGTVTLSGTATRVYTAGTYSVTTTAGTLTATVSGTVTRADLREANIGVGLPAYQRVGNTSINAADYDTAGFPAWLRCSGGQSMVTSSINFTGTSKATVWAGVRKLSDAAATIVEIANINSDSVFTLLASGYENRSGSYGPAGSLGTYGNAGALSSALLTTVQEVSYSANGTIASDFIAVKINGVFRKYVPDVLQPASDRKFSNSPLYLFAHNQSSLFLSGLAGPIIVRGAQSSAAEIANAEAWINAQQKVY